MSLEKETLYTARWYAKEIQAKSSETAIKKLGAELEKVLTHVIDDGPQAHPMPAQPPAPVATPGKLPRRYPGAKQLKQVMPTRGSYKGGWPKGAIVHFTSGRDGGEKTIDGGIKSGYAFLCIQKDGVMCQAHDNDKWGYHAGKSSWKGLDGTVSDELVGVEINNAGSLDKLPDGRFKTWFNTYVESKDVRYTPGVANQDKGHYEKYTPAQETTLIEFFLWMKAQAPEIFSFDFVLGHDEVAPGRKNDPGASLSVTMPEFRAYLKAEWERRKKA